MKLNLNGIQKICLSGIVATAVQIVTMNPAFANELSEEASASAATPADPVSTSAADKQVQNQQSPGSADATPAEWVIHMRGIVGTARTSSIDDFSSDRFGAAVFAGTILSNVELPMLLADAKDFSLGLSYQTFTGVLVGQNQAAALQSLGAQARFVLVPSFLSGADLSVHGGIALQRLVFESQADGLEKAELGGAVTAGAYVRWLVHGPVAVLAGADLVAGNASWAGISAGVEASF
ncbi:MAG: hypothetical protein RJB13_2406 [Pseudomonadota bacterium]